MAQLVTCRQHNSQTWTFTCTFYVYARDCHAYTFLTGL